MIWGVLYDNQNQALHSVTIYHAIEGVITFIFIMLLKKKKLSPGYLTAYYLVIF